MKEKKNIDRLFQEQLKDFESIPDPQIWLNIEAELKKDKKKRMVIPFWFRYAGNAAALLLGFLLFHNYTTSPTDINSTTVVTTIDTINKSNALTNENKEKSPLLPIKQTQQVVVTNPKNSNDDEKENTVVVSAKENKKSKNTKANSPFHIPKNNTSVNQAIVSKTESKQNISRKQPTLKHSEQTNDSVLDQAVVSRSESKDKILVKKAVINHSTSNTDSVTNEGIATKNELKKETVNTTSLAENPTHSNNIKDNANVIIQASVANNKIDENLATTETKKTEENNATTPNELEAILKSKTTKDTQIAQVVSKKWEIAPNIAPIYLQSSAGGSPIDNNLSENAKTADKTMSYGIGIKYALNRKIALRTGINKVVLGYNTNDVYYSAGFASNNMANITYSPTAAVELKSATQYNSFSPTEKEIQQTNLGSINQKMGYYEFPLEVSYALLNKKIGVSIIGGFSTLFLNENSIALESAQANISLGEANNLNKVHVSSNFGIGFKYQFLKSFQFNFEPMVKYQLNTFSKNDNDFKPLFIGLYSGVSYRF
ncbi:hypothetical protein [Flavobacterium sp. PL002]|uniref:hypothetical protein n=1 Tax=Flavobacterium sp. PL002 TaxID=1897058 RepID=UPI00178873BE|nr:hypothetical protein [Flavobacterium sp. PL002]MBE0392064.1 hypothetical protein [Flavobacterium sp. PL002]